MNNNTKALKSGIWYLAANFAMSALTFLTTPLFTRILTKNDFGIYSAYSSWVQILCVIVPLNFSATMVCAKFDYADSFKEYAFSCMIFSSVFTAFWCIIFNIFSDFFKAFFGLDIAYINIMMAYLCFLPAINIFLSAERCCFEFKKAVTIAVLQAVGTALLGIVLVVIMSNKLMGRVAGSAIPTIAIGMILMVYYSIKIKRVSFSYLPYAMKICLPLVPNTLSLVVLNSIDRVMVNDICGAEDAALYSLAYTCSMVITVLVAAMNDAFFPWLAEKINANEYSEIKAFSKKYVLAFLLVVIGLMLLAPEIMIVLGGKQYLSAKSAMPPIMIGCAYQLIYSMYANVEQIKKETIGMACASVIAAVANCVLNAVFIPRFGYVAAAYTTLAGYLILVILHMLLVKRIGMIQVFDNKTVLLALAGTLVLVLINEFLYSHFAIRCIILIAYLAMVAMFAVKNKERITNLVNCLIH